LILVVAVIGIAHVETAASAVPRSEASGICESPSSKKALRQAKRRAIHFLSFIADQFSSSYAAAVSTYPLGSASNSFLQSSEQKKYFLPANCVWNSPFFFSSILIPQTGSVVMLPPAREFVRHPPTARTLPFSGLPK
jgi:hypothetical protein